MCGIMAFLKQLFLVKSGFGFDLETGGLIIGALDFLESTSFLIRFIQTTFAVVNDEQRNEAMNLIAPYICCLIASAALFYAIIKRDYAWARLWIWANMVYILNVPCVLGYISAYIDKDSIAMANPRLNTYASCLAFLFIFVLRLYFHAVIYSLYKKTDQKNLEKKPENNDVV